MLKLRGALAALAACLGLAALPALSRADDPATYVASILDQNADGSYPALYQPRTLSFAEDGTLYVTGIRWYGWNSGRASGYGTAHLRGCIPNCAEGQTRRFRTVMVANRRKDLDGTYVYEGLWIHAASSGTRRTNWAEQLGSIS